MTISAKNLPAALLAAATAAAGLTAALEVTPGSRCAAECLDSPEGNPYRATDSTTTTGDISCRDVDYSTTDVGIKFRKCLDCLQSSKKVDKAESDLKWYTYNLRYTLSTCLYGSPNAVKDGTVAAQCDLGRACKPLKEPLIAAGFDANPNSTWDYCTAKDGTFMGASLSPCISCLQATQGEVYLSNFMTALKAGCMQQPADGNLLSLSGSVFTTNAINMTDPGGRNQGSESSSPLSPSAIAGIAVGVFLIFALATALLVLHFRRERAYKQWHQNQYYDSFSSPGAYSHQEGGMSQAYRRYYTGNAFSEKPPHPSHLPPPAANSAGEYYDRMAAELQAASRMTVNQRVNANANANANPQGHTTSSAAEPQPHHDGFSNRSTSRSRSINQITPAHTPSPSAPARPQRRSNTPDSFAEQAYLHAAEESARLAAQRTPPLSGTPQSAAFTDKTRSSMVPSASMPQTPKLRLPKMYNPAKLFTGRGSSKNDRELQISPPLMTHDPRFHDIPMAGPVVVSRERPPPLAPVNRGGDAYVEVPLRSGKSALYG
ncbi:hypothetical protein QQS21_003352 [Conoideocrella luteorostrata]|uniref:LPXTG-domain-containing protein n=1 Tax=Conoideocrella luteorostrata TaxID=1105319 RepID=A0AAJ0FVL3_9HYPO|nr:hypothetical protein QQS21_003352 [Conoideocrella luteorostrata]